MIRVPCVLVIAVALTGCSASVAPGSEHVEGLLTSPTISLEPKSFAITYHTAPSVGAKLPDGRHFVAGQVPNPEHLDLQPPLPITLEVTAYWNATHPAAQSLFIVISNDSASWTAEGESPLTLPTVGDLRPGDHWFGALPAHGGATVDEAVTFVFTLRYT